MAAKTSRLFIALPVEYESFSGGLSEVYRGLERYSGVIKKVDPLNLHITLKFLGDVDEEKYSKMKTGFSSFENTPGINYSIKGIGCFPDIASPSVIWTGIECDTKKITDLFMKVEEYCVSFGFAKDTRRFTPHLTMARIKRGRDIPGGLKEFIRGNRDKIYGEGSFKRLVLFESKLDSIGPEYKAGAEVKLI